MIFDKLDNLKNYEKSVPYLQDFLDFAKKNDINALPLGKTIISENVFVNKLEYVAKELENAKGESHIAYTDIQIILSGVERMDFDDITLVPDKSSEFNYEKDVVKYDEPFTNTAIVKENQFCVFFPQDVHRPCIKVSEEPVKKLVVKLKVK